MTTAGDPDIDPCDPWDVEPVDDRDPADPWDDADRSHDAERDL
jgi:hypothetical protein